MDLSSNYHGVVINEETVIKRGSHELMKLEYEKTLQAYNIFNKSDVINVPRILDYNQEEGKIIFERIKNVTNVGRFQNFTNDSIETAAKIGLCLANIHTSYKLPDNLIEPLPIELAEHNSQQVFIHGDMTGDNILYRASDNKLFIIDWMMTKKHKGKATYGTAFFDVAWFINFQFYSKIKLDYFKRDIENETFAFLKSYSKSINFDFNLREFSNYLLKFLNYKIPLRKKILPYHVYIRLWPSHQRFLRFAKRLKANQYL